MAYLPTKIPVVSSDWRLTVPRWSSLISKSLGTYEDFPYFARTPERQHFGRMMTIKHNFLFICAPRATLLYVPFHLQSIHSCQHRRLHLNTGMAPFRLG